MGTKNYLIEGISGSGKTSVATELQRRGYHVVHGDRELAYAGDPATGEPVDPTLYQNDVLDAEFLHRHHIWNVEKVRSLATDQTHPMTFFCGGSRNFHMFISMFDDVFVLDVDAVTLRERLAERSEDEFGGVQREQQLILTLHSTGEDLPANASVIDSTKPLMVVVDDILSRCDG